MVKEYKLLSGEKINLSELPEEQQRHISRIEELIAKSVDYHEVDRQAFTPLNEGRIFTAKALKELHDSPQYLVLLDLMNRYYFDLKLFLPPQDRK